MADVPGIHGALASAAGQIGALAKTEKNKEQGFMFRSIDAILAASKPVFAELGISVTPRVIEKDYQEITAKSGARGWRCTVTMAYQFALAEDGSTVHCSMAGEAIDYGDKATTKAEQMAYKYVLTQVLGIGSTEADPDSESHEVATTTAGTAAETGGTWLANAVEALKLWSKDQRVEAYNAVVDELGVRKDDGSVDVSMKVAKQIFEGMHKAYMIENPAAADEAPF